MWISISILRKDQIDMVCHPLIIFPVYFIGIGFIISIIVSQTSFEKSEGGVKVSNSIFAYAYM